jgi:soluble lytic murein transglycosylase-like protein
MSPLLVLLFTTSTTLYKLPPNLLSSLCYVESKYNVLAIHKDDGTSNSVGVCQVKLKTAKWLGFEGTEKELMNPETNIWYAAKYLSYQLKRYHGNVKKAVIAYNIGNAKGLTSTKYSAKVLKQWRINNVRCSANSCDPNGH